MWSKHDSNNRNDVRLREREWRGESKVVRARTDACPPQKQKPPSDLLGGGLKFNPNSG